MRIAELAAIEPSVAVLACYPGLDSSAPDDYRQLAALLVDDWRRRGRARIGLGGGQGAGKSTLGRLIVDAGAAFGMRIEVLSLDDFYLPRAERRRLAREVHPLLATRGPPGTHDVGRLRRAMAALGRDGLVQVPRFDKGIDDRAGYREVRGAVDIVVVEGWCIGAPPARLGSEPTAALNALETQHDADGRWRRYVESALGSVYTELHRDLDTLVFLEVPDLDAVRRWRMQQEGERPPAQRMTAAQVRRFVEHYERITLRMLAALPDTAEVVVRLDDGHRVVALRLAD